MNTLPCEQCERRYVEGRHLFCTEGVDSIDVGIRRRLSGTYPDAKYSKFELVKDIESLPEFCPYSLEMTLLIIDKH